MAKDPKKEQQKKQDKINVVLYKAVMRQDSDAALSALHAGADPNLIFTRSGFKEFFIGAPYPNPIICRAVQRGNLEMVQMLLDHGANPNVRRENSWYKNTPLIDALDQMHFDIATELFKKDADPYMKDTEGHDAVYWAEKRGAYDLLREMRKTSPYKDTDLLVTDKKLPLDEEISFREKHSASIVEHTFHFKRRERTSLAYDAKGEEVKAITMTSFDDIPKATLTYIFNLYQEKGGRKSEQDLLYPDHKLDKPGLKNEK